MYRHTGSRPSSHVSRTHVSSARARQSNPVLQKQPTLEKQSALETHHARNNHNTDHAASLLKRTSKPSYKREHISETSETIKEKYMPTIYLVDDDENILTSVSMYLENEGYRVQKFHDGVSALTALKNSPPDLAVFDVKMPRMDGLELLRRLRQTSNLPVIFLTSKDDEIDEAMGLNMGADDYITKPFSQRLLGERIKAILRRAAPLNAGISPALADDPNVMRRGSLVLDANRHACTWNGSIVRLTVTEFLILESLARRPGFVKSRDQLMDAAYDDQIYVDDRTIDSHIKRLRKKFRKTDTAFDGIETLYGVGYKYKEA